MCGRERMMGANGAGRFDDVPRTTTELGKHGPKGGICWLMVDWGSGAPSGPGIGGTCKTGSGTSVWTLCSTVSMQ